MQQETSQFIARITDAVMAKIDEREKINLIAQAVIDQIEHGKIGTDKV